MATDVTVARNADCHSAMPCNHAYLRAITLFMCSFMRYDIELFLMMIFLLLIVDCDIAMMDDGSFQFSVITSDTKWD